MFKKEKPIVEEVPVSREISRSYVNPFSEVIMNPDNTESPNTKVDQSITISRDLSLLIRETEDIAQDLHINLDSNKVEDYKLVDVD